MLVSPSTFVKHKALPLASVTKLNKTTSAVFRPRSSILISWTIRWN